MKKIDELTLISVVSGNRIPVEYRNNKEMAQNLLENIKFQLPDVKITGDLLVLGRWCGFIKTEKEYSTVKSIEYSNVQKTYDIEVDDDSHSFKASGIVVHNTVNLPANTDIPTVSNIFMEAYDSGCKGITIYRDGCRQGVMASNITGAGNVNGETSAKKRPEMLPCDIFRFTNGGEKWIACVGIMDGRPYEIFTGKAESLQVPNNVNDGVIIKVKKKGENSHYDLRYVDCDGYHVTIEGINRMFDPEFWNYGKFLSAVLRHGMGIQYVVEMLNTLSFENDSINSWRAGVVRSLKKWIKDGTKSSEKCPNCGNELTYENGCKTCHYCGYSLCQ